MLRTLLTFWYTVSTVLGPCVCCCAVQRAIAAEAVAGKQAPVPKKRCCSAPEDHGAQPARKPRKDHAPSGCPCKHAAADQVSPYVGVAGRAEVVGHFRGPEHSPFDPVLPPASASLTTLANLGWGPPDPPGGKRSGRELLSAYHILLC